MKNLQKAGGISALLSAASYVFAIGLFLTLMRPLADPGIGIGDYVAFSTAHSALIYVWTFSMYILHGVCLVVLVLALHERLRAVAPRLSLVASGLGLIWTAFVLLSGFINLWGNGALVELYAKSPAGADTFKTALTAITAGIDTSDRCLGSLWMGLVSLGALKSKAMPKPASILGLVAGAAALVLSLVLPVTDVSASFLFAFGAILWWLILGVFMVRRPGLEAFSAA